MRAGERAGNTALCALFEAKGVCKKDDCGEKEEEKVKVKHARLHCGRWN